MTSLGEHAISVIPTQAGIQGQRQFQGFPALFELLHMGIKSADRFTRLLTDILDISRIEAGKIEIRWEPFNPLERHNSVADLVIHGRPRK